MRARRTSATLTALSCASTTQTPAPSNTPTEAAASDVALQQVLSAYAVLGDAARRAEYDRRRGPTSRRDIRQNAPVYRTHAAPTLDSPIQAGPVRWHAQYRP